MPKPPPDLSAAVRLRYLRDLSGAVGLFLVELDLLMRERGSDLERGRRIALLANQLEIVNDRVRFFALGGDDRTDVKKGRKE